jgi:hypothetical protein
MDGSLNEMMPWGLTLAQTTLICGGGLLLIFGWYFFKLIFQIGQFVFTVGISLLILVGLCAAVMFIVYNLTS